MRAYGMALEGWLLISCIITTILGGHVTESREYETGESLGARQRNLTLVCADSSYLSLKFQNWDPKRRWLLEYLDLGSFTRPH